MLTRVWAKIDDDLLGRVDEIGRLSGEKRGKTVERMIKAECYRPQDLLTVELSTEALEVVKDMAIAQKRTVDAQAAWIVEEFCKKGKRSE
jgi:hypothetical protein